MEMVDEALDEAKKKAEIHLNYTWTLIHKWFKEDDEKQKMVAYAYKLWWMDFVKLIECENWNRNIHAIGDWWYAFWLCQINVNYHKLPEWFKENRQTQVEYCYDKFLQGTKFYGPSRLIKWVKCSKYVENRFILK